MDGDIIKSNAKSRQKVPFNRNASLNLVKPYQLKAKPKIKEIHYQFLASLGTTKEFLGVEMTLGDIKKLTVKDVLQEISSGFSPGTPVFLPLQIDFHAKI